VQIKIEKTKRFRVPGSSIIYLPSGKYLRLVTFGFNSLLADIIYIWAIQYYSDYRIKDRFNYLEHIFSIISALDPYYIDPYRIGALIAWYEGRRIDLALKILDMGIKKNPNDWILPFEAGHYAQMYKKDYKLAQYYYGITMKIKGAPPLARRLYAAAAFKAMDLETAYRNWLEIYQTAKDKRIKKIAYNHLYRTKATIDTIKLEKAIRKFKEKYNRLPMNLNQLVRAGILNKIPKDLDGNDYIYNPHTGEIKTPYTPWKKE
jgi:tetratricopeptide (TPR) repeat protein